MTIGALQGLWRRTVIERPGAAPDRSTEVSWLQGRRFYVDLRQRPDRPSFADIRCLRQLGEREIAWLAGQEGFAGELTVADDHAEWHRAIDIQPASSLADRARLERSGDRLAEYGTEAEYFEEWQRQPGEAEPCWGLSLAAGKLSARLVRVGAVFAYARSRPQVIGAAATLAELVAAAPSLAAKQDLLDLEISFGRVDGEERWTIERSSLPFKEGTILARQSDVQQPEQMQIADIAPDGTAVTRIWQIVGVDQAAAVLPPDNMDPDRGEPTG
jgi:hypothetical protein